MEEILASIRRIISEDDAPAETAAAAPEPVVEAAPEPEPVVEIAAEEPAPVEDEVLELVNAILCPSEDEVSNHPMSMAASDRIFSQLVKRENEKAV